VLQPDDLPPTGEGARSAIEGFTQREYELLRRELAEAQALNRGLRRQLEKALQSANEAQRAHAKMVATLTETMRENTTLSHELETWRTRAQRLEAGLGPTPPPAPRSISPPSPGGSATTR
jgi:hypothetical protein